MGVSDSQTIIVEFVGPPGGGKTTLCDGLKTQLANNGLKTAIFKDVKRHLREKSLFSKLAFVLSNTFKNLPVFLTFSVLLFKSGVFSINSIIRYYKVTLFNGSISSFINNSKTQVLLLDQWSVQQLWSATIFRAKDYERLKSNLVDFFLEPDVMIYVDINLSIASERVSGRSSMTSRFDKMSENERTKYLHEYNDYLKSLFMTSRAKNKLTISGNQELSTNVEKLFIYLKDTFNTTNTRSR